MQAARAGRARPRSRPPFLAGFTAHIDQAACIQCGACLATCRFGAVYVKNGCYGVDALRCEGCLACTLVCPQQAIEARRAESGELLISDTEHGTLVHARLLPGRENSGKLVSAVRKEAAVQAKRERAGLVIADGAPGIGCPVIAALAGVDLALLVTEPTPAGEQGIERVLSVAQHFGVPANRADLSAENTAAIERRLAERGVPLLGRIPYDRSVVEATASLRPAVLAASAPVREALTALAAAVFERLEREPTPCGASRRPECDGSCLR
ncbi:MAG: 4Fe-4S binding protein [Planctomycetes bacterium]|nr:4Fe-4S binding protein [Planctomycetota bacterium]